MYSTMLERENSEFRFVPVYIPCFSSWIIHVEECQVNDEITLWLNTDRAWVVLGTLHWPPKSKTNRTEPKVPINWGRLHVFVFSIELNREHRVPWYPRNLFWITASEVNFGVPLTLLLPSTVTISLETIHRPILDRHVRTSLISSLLVLSSISSTLSHIMCVRELEWKRERESESVFWIPSKLLKFAKARIESGKEGLTRGLWPRCPLPGEGFCFEFYLVHTNLPCRICRAIVEAKQDYVLFPCFAEGSSDVKMNVFFGR